MSMNRLSHKNTNKNGSCNRPKLNNNLNFHNAHISIKNKKGQHYSLDLIIASTIFIILFLFVSSNWDKTRMTFQNVEKRNVLEETTKHSFDALIYGKGEPTNWQNVTSFKKIGIADDKIGFVDYDKISKLKFYNNSMYQKYKEDLGMIGPGYEFSMNATIYNQDMSFNSTYSIGYYGDCKEVSSKTRIIPTENKKYVYINFLGCEKE